MTLAEVSKLKVSELKDELNKLGLPLAGLKKTLAARLTEALEVRNLKSISLFFAHEVVMFVDVSSSDLIPDQ